MSTPASPNRPRRRPLILGTLATLLLPLGACGGSDGGDAPPTARPRRWRMGFSPNPPRYTVADVIKTIDLWSPRAELAILHDQPPWADLLAGRSPESLVQRERVDLVAYLRSKGLGLIFMGDLNDGLAREREAPALLAAGRSIAEPEVQALYRDYLLSIDRMLKPDTLGLVAESNLIRVAAPTLYPAIRKTANDTASALRAAGSAARLMVSVQVDAAWGRLDGSSAYVGIEQDYLDFPFIDVLGLSSYPYFGWPSPEDIPLNYYSRLVEGRSTPVMVVEGGWPSAGAGAVESSPERQVSYLDRQAALLDAVAAQAWLQLSFTDMDLSELEPPIPANLPLFASLGLVDKNYAAKPGLAAWDRIHARAFAD